MVSWEHNQDFYSVPRVNWFEHRGNKDNIDKEQVVKWENRYSMYNKNT